MVRGGAEPPGWTRAPPLSPCPLGSQEAVFEDVPVGTVILTVTASDADSGNFALIEYSLGDGEGKFAINPTTVSRQAGREKGPGSEAEKPPQVL